ncbi:MAG: DUF3540 domain-containing protein [Candidatus Electrothrix scaldis]|nr:MAG: DUF3540 domain-containing protein [Candidatus Electrothrix sp. GW3-3]
MKTASPLYEKKSDIRLSRASVQRITGTTYFVSDTFRLIRAERAPSCLLQPEQNDLVLISEDTFGNVNILTILEREEKKAAMLSVAGDLSITAPQKLSLQGGQGINMLTKKISLTADQGKIKLNELAFAGELFTACGRQLHSLYQHVEIHAKGIIERANRLYRRIKNEDSRLGRMQCRVQEDYNVQAKDGFFDADNLMDLKGKKKIELG